MTRPVPLRHSRCNRRSASQGAPQLGFTEQAPPSNCSLLHPRNPGPAQKLAKRGLRVGRTSVGKGVFATKRIVDGCCIGEIQGHVITDELYVSRYSFDLNDGSQLEPEYPFRYVNHSCEPNCAFEKLSFHKPAQDGSPPRTLSEQLAPDQRLLLFAICDIAIGQELTIDYKWPATFAIRCHCRTPLCRGWIVDPNELAQVVQDGKG